MPKLPLDGRRLLLVGRFAALSRKEIDRLIRLSGGKIAENPHPGVDLIVLGEGAPLGTEWLNLSELLDRTTRTAFEQGKLETITETELLARLDLSETALSAKEHPLYTGAMLAELTSVLPSTIRHWQELGLLVPVRRTGQLYYYEVEEVLTANKLKMLTAAGFEPEVLRTLIQRFEMLYPENGRVLPRLILSGDGQTLLLPINGQLFDLAGQQFFEWATDPVSEKKTESGYLNDKEINDQSLDDAVIAPAESVHLGTIEDALETRRGEIQAIGPEETAQFHRKIGERVVELCETAADLAEKQQYQEAIRCCRTALCLGGIDAGISFQLAELLALTGDWPAARERYYNVLELEEDHLEARFGLGCALVHTGEEEDALNVFRGILTMAPDYLDVRLELGRLLYRLGQTAEAEEHLRFFKEKDPHSTKISIIDAILRENNE